MIGVCCPGTAFLLTHLKVMSLNDVVESVVAYTVLFSEVLPVHAPELVAPDTAVFLADAFDILHDEGLFRQFAKKAVPVLIVGLGTYTKQLTLRRDGIFLHVAGVKPTDYLVPAFFKSIP